MNIKYYLPLEYISDEFRCLEEREQALKTSNESGIPIFVPVCKENGQYVDIQCHQGTGYCWCVNLDGKPVPRSSTKYKKPNCRKTGKLSLNIKMERIMGGWHSNTTFNTLISDSRKRNRRGKKKMKGKRMKKTRGKFITLDNYKYMSYTNNLFFKCSIFIILDIFQYDALMRIESNSIRLSLI